MSQQPPAAHGLPVPIEELERLDRLAPGSAAMVIEQLDRHLQRLQVESQRVRRANLWLQLGPRLIGLAGWFACCAVAAFAIANGEGGAAVSISAAYGGTAVAVLVTGRRATSRQPEPSAVPPGGAPTSGG